MKIIKILILILTSIHIYSTELYSDEWVRGCARMSLSTSGNDFTSVKCLDIVPVGETLKISNIFVKLNIDPKAIKFIGVKTLNMVSFCEWKISNNYKISIMTNYMGNDDVKNYGLDLDGYGVRIIKSE